MVRPWWLDHVVKNVQTTSGQLLLADAEESHAIVIRFARELPPPTTKLEQVILRGILLEFACRCGDARHERAHGTSPVRCAFIPTAFVEEFWKDPSDTPQAAFARWAEAFFEGFQALHQPSVANLAARLIRQNYQRSWTATALAQHFNVTPSWVQRTFASEFGMSVREYQRLLRLQEALEHIGTNKIDAIALQVGYKSKKDFYRAFRHLTGLTPTGFRALPGRQAAEMIETLVERRWHRRRSSDRRVSQIGARAGESDRRHD